MDGQQKSYDSRMGGFAPWQATPCLRCGLCCTHWQPQLGEEDVEGAARKLAAKIDAGMLEAVPKGE